MEKQRLLRKPNILVVDDKRANFVVLDAVLGDDNNMLYACSGAQAIAMLQVQHKVDVVLMDVQMPEMDGFETARHIKNLPGCHDLPIIFITAVYHEDPYIKKGFEAGGVDYFCKPFDPDILKIKVGVYASYRQRIDLFKERERHIRESEELLRVGRKLSSVLETLPVGVLIADVEGRICQTTEAVSRILKSVEPIESDSYGEILGWWDAGGHKIKDERGPLARALRTGEVSHREPVHIRCVDGSAKTILSSASPLRRLDGQIVGAVILIQDVTETKQLKQALEERVTNLIAIGMELEESVKQ